MRPAALVHLLRDCVVAGDLAPLADAYADEAVLEASLTLDDVVEDFRHALGERDDPLAPELGLISGLLQYGWIFGHSAVVHTDPAERE